MRKVGFGRLGCGLRCDVLICLTIRLHCCLIRLRSVCCVTLPCASKDALHQRQLHRAALVVIWWMTQQKQASKDTLEVTVQ